MPRPYRTALMPVGTVVEFDGATYKKTSESRREPFPWADEWGGVWGDGRIACLLDDGAQIIKEY